MDRVLALLWIAGGALAGVPKAAQHQHHEQGHTTTTTTTAWPVGCDVLPAAAKLLADAGLPRAYNPDEKALACEAVAAIRMGASTTEAGKGLPTEILMCRAATDLAALGTRLELFAAVRIARALQGIHNCTVRPHVSSVVCTDDNPSTTHACRFAIHSDSCSIDM